jgi:hypothetical protein
MKGIKMSERVKVTKTEYDKFIEDFPGGAYEHVRFSTPFRHNYWYGDEFIAYYYDSYGSDPAEYFVEKALI